MSLAVFVITMIYASKRYGIMMSRRDTVHQRTEETYIYPLEDPLIMKDAQFKFAFQVYSFNDFKFRPIDIEGYLEINLEQIQWD